MLKFSTSTDYAIVALSHLCMNECGDSLKSIASSYFFSAQLTANVMKQLASADIIKGKRGVNGGYSLNKSPKEIKMSHILRVMEGNFYLVKCIQQKGICLTENVCPARSSLHYISGKNG